MLSGAAVLFTGNNLGAEIVSLTFPSGTNTLYLVPGTLAVTCRYKYRSYSSLLRDRKELIWMGAGGKIG